MPEDVQPDRADDVHPDYADEVVPGRAEPQAVGVQRVTASEQRQGDRRRGRLAVLVGVALAIAIAAWLLGPKIFGGPKPPVTTSVRARKTSSSRSTKATRAR